MESVLHPDGDEPGMGPGPAGPDRRFYPFTLTTETGKVIVPNGGYHSGDQVPQQDLTKGITITEDDKVIGVLVPIPTPFQGRPREVEFLDRTNRILLDGALVGAVIALLLGIFLSRTLTRPIRELTRATHAVSEGDLSQQVPVRSSDELGELAQAFNKMSSELARSVNSRKQMTADIAHELRTPLSLILGHAEAVHDGVLPPSPENFEIIREEATRPRTSCQRSAHPVPGGCGRTIDCSANRRAPATPSGGCGDLSISYPAQEYYPRPGH